MMSPRCCRATKNRWRVPKRRRDSQGRMDQPTLAPYGPMVEQGLTGQPRGRMADGAGVQAALETVGLCKSFGALRVADDIDFRLARGARHALIGPNGAGKTTLLNLITGALPPSAGRIR